MLTNAQILDTLKSDAGIIIVEFERPLGFRFVEFAEYLRTLIRAGY